MTNITVAIRAEGSDGYVVYFQVTGKPPVDLRRFPPAGDVAQAKEEARQYRDGVAEGLYRARCIVEGIFHAPASSAPCGVTS